jgi:hypothetical protein
MHIDEYQNRSPIFSPCCYRRHIDILTQDGVKQIRTEPGGSGSSSSSSCAPTRIGIGPTTTTTATHKTSINNTVAKQKRQRRQTNIFNSRNFTIQINIIEFASLTTKLTTMKAAFALSLSTNLSIAMASASPFPQAVSMKFHCGVVPSQLHLHNHLPYFHITHFFCPHLGY